MSCIFFYSNSCIIYSDTIIFWLLVYIVYKFNKVYKRLEEIEDKKLDKEIYKYLRERDEKFKDFVPFSVRNGYDKEK